MDDEVLQTNTKAGIDQYFQENIHQFEGQINERNGFWSSK